MSTATITGPIYGASFIHTFTSMSVVFELSHWDREEDVGLITAGPQVVPVDENGDFSVDLFVNASGENYTNYKAYLRYARTGAEHVQEYLGYFTLTSAGTFKLADLEIITQQEELNLLDVYSYVRSIADNLQVNLDTRDQEIRDMIDILLLDAPQALDTFKELSDALLGDPDSVSNLMDMVAKRISVTAPQTFTLAEVIQASTNIGFGDLTADLIATYETQKDS